MGGGTGASIHSVFFEWHFIAMQYYSSAVYIIQITGSVLGSRLFTLYTADLTDVANKHCVTIHMFTDDTVISALWLRHYGINYRQITALYHGHYHWMSASRLKLNMDKTDLIWTGTKYSVTAGNASFLSLQLGEDVILPSQRVRLLGLVISADLGVEKHVSNVSATCFHHLRQHIQRSLSTESATTLVHAFVTSGIDYCTIVFVEAPKSVTNKLQ